MTREELDKLAHDNAGKAAYEFHRDNLETGDEWLQWRWEDLYPDVREKWIALCLRESDAFLETYKRLGDQVPLEDHHAYDEYKKELES